MTEETMKGFMNKIASAVALTWLLIACESSEVQLGTESHFVTCESDAQCGSGLRCIDSLCTRSCATDADCETVSHDARCVEQSCRPPEVAQSDDDPGDDDASDDDLSDDDLSDDDLGDDDLGDDDLGDDDLGDDDLGDDDLGDDDLGDDDTMDPAAVADAVCSWRCLSDADCDGRACLDGACAPLDCLSGGSCPQGQVCVNSDGAGRCFVPCDENSGCVDNFGNPVACDIDPSSGFSFCPPVVINVNPSGSRCAEQNDCSQHPLGEACLLDLDAAHAGEPCGCTGDGHCAFTSGGSVCLTEVERCGCDGDEDCPSAAASRCNLETGRCGCATAMDCPATGTGEWQCLGDDGAGGSGPQGSGGTVSQGGAAGAGPGGAGTGGAANGGSAGASGTSCTGDEDCGSYFNCCDGHCVNLANDPYNCGACGSVCGDDEFFCNGGCGAPVCDEPCVGAELCCVVSEGPVFVECYEPVSGTCPVGHPGLDCASLDSMIATPTGERRIDELQPGDVVYSVEGAAIVEAPIVAVRKTAVWQHELVRVTLRTGRVVEMSARHPTADGGSFGMLVVGGVLGDVEIVAVDAVPYSHPFTYDILPATTSGSYFASGALVGTTLSR